VDPQSSKLSGQVRCSRCRREPRDDADGHLVAALAANRPAEVAALRRDLAAPAQELALAGR